MPSLHPTPATSRPDAARLARCLAAPAAGPRVVFFSGGSALRETCPVLARYTHHSVHLVTPFDSGGSSAPLRRAFRMLAVGDLRNRLLALADPAAPGQPALGALLGFRLPRDETPRVLRRLLADVISGAHPLSAAVPPGPRRTLAEDLADFAERMPARFDLRDASLGNLVLVGAFLREGRRIGPALDRFTRLVRARGTVAPTTDVSLHLAAELRDGATLVGQHRLTGKEAPPIRSPIARLYLTRGLSAPAPVVPRLPARAAELIRGAALVCYPVGSFYTSVLPNLLVGGVAEAIAESGAPTVYVPNTAPDPEQLGLGLAAAARTLQRTLRDGLPARVPAERLLGTVLCDEGLAATRPREVAALSRLGVQVRLAPLVTRRSAPRVDPERLVPHLLGLARL